MPGDHRLLEMIVEASAPLNEQIGLLITIPGITPLTASAFLADIGEAHRFPSPRRMNAYLGCDRGNDQLSRSGSNPGGDRPILTRCRRILLTSSGSSMTAIPFISPPHF